MESKSKVAATERLWKISGYRPFGIIARDPNESTYKIGDDKFPIIVDVRGDTVQQHALANRIVADHNAYSPEKEAAYKVMKEALNQSRRALNFLPQDALGRDVTDGHFYRDELLAQVEAALALADKVENPDQDQG